MRSWSARIRGGSGPCSTTAARRSRARGPPIRWSCAGSRACPEVRAASPAGAAGVALRSYNVIYDAINDVKAALSGMLAPEIRETLLGRAQVRQLFPITKVGTIFGCAVTEGKIVRGARVRVKRGDT